jgi:hypothetical protein
MKIKCAAGLLIAFCMPSWGQTNGCSPTIGLSLPPVHLRVDFGLEPCKTSQTNVEKLTLEGFVHLEQPTLQGSVQTVMFEHSENDLQSSVIRPGEFYLTRPEPKSESGVLRFVDDIFTPEYFRVGKATVSSPFATVIKKKNPLCFLSSLTPSKLWTGDGQLDCKLLEISW